MPVCEQCGVTFEYSKDKPEEVTSLRILCAPCTEQRRQQKLAAAQGGGRPAARPAAGAKAPATRPAAAGSTPGKAAPPPARNATPSTATTSRIAPEKPAPARPAAHANNVSSPAQRPASLGGKPAPPAKPRTDPGTSTKDIAKIRAEARRAEAIQRARDAVEAGGDKKPLLDKPTKIGLISAGGLAVAVVIVLFIVQGKKDADKKAVEERKARIDTFIAAMKALDVKDPGDSRLAISKANDNLELWQGSSVVSDVNTIIANAKTTLQNDADRQAFLERLVAVETKLRDVSQLAPPDLLEARGSLRNMQTEAKLYGPDLEGRTLAALDTASRSYLTRLIDDAKSYATQHPEEPRQALNKFAAAEDEITTQRDALMASPDHDKEKDKKTLLDSYLHDVIAQQDTLAEKLFTDAYIAGLPWRDLLVPGEKENWLYPALPGFSAKFDGGKLVVTGPGPESKGQAILTIGDKEKWRDFVMEMEIKVASGVVDTYYRLPRVVDNRTESFRIDSTESEDGGPGIKPGKAYQFTIAFIGSKLAITPSEEAREDVDAHTFTSDDWKSRKGAFGFTVPKGTAFEVTRLRIKNLR